MKLPQLKQENGKARFTRTGGFTMVEMMTATSHGASNRVRLVRNEPRNSPGSTRTPPIIAATMATPVGSQIGAGNTP